MRNFTILFIFLFIFDLNSLKNDELAYWILLEQGRQILYVKDNGLDRLKISRAISYLQEALLRQGLFPEANYYLSVAYGITGNIILEELHLKKALENKDYLIDKNLEKKILFSLAKLYELKSNYVNVIDYLNQILKRFSEKKDYYNFHDAVKENEQLLDNFDISLYLDSYLSTVRKTSGIDFTFGLYRFNNYNVIDAHQFLAKIYLDASAYKLSVTHGLIATIGILTRVYQYVTYYEPLYQFKNLRSFVAKINEYNDIKYSFNSTNFWEILYNLATATYVYENGKHSTRALDTWKLISDLAPSDSIYIYKSRSQIQNPVVIRSVYF